MVLSFAREAPLVCVWVPKLQTPWKYHINSLLSHETVATTTKGILESGIAYSYKGFGSQPVWSMYDIGVERN